MIIRLSAKLAEKLKVQPSSVLPLDDNPFADWSATLFTVERIQYILVTNTASLYSTVFQGRGVSSSRAFAEQMLSSLQAFMRADGHEEIFERYVAPDSADIQYSKALNRSVISSMNNLILFAKIGVHEDSASLLDVGFQLNEVIFSKFKYERPRMLFMGLLSQMNHRMGNSGEAND